MKLQDGIVYVEGRHLAYTVELIDCGFRVHIGDYRTLDESEAALGVGRRVLKAYRGHVERETDMANLKKAVQNLDGAKE